MAPHEYALGTVAVIRESVTDLGEFQAVKDEKGWASLLPGIGWVGDADVIDVRPLVVIDPDDAGQAVQFARGYIEAHAYSATPWEKRAEESRDRIIGAVLNGFRSLAKPPKPAEPTGLGAVVEDAEGNRWTRARGHEHGLNWRQEWGGLWRYWDDIDVVRVLSEGVTA